MTAILKITDGTTTFDLLAEEGRGGFHLRSWRPAIVDKKGGGVWQDPVLADGRQPAFGKWANAVETFALVVDDFSTDALIETEMQEIRRLFEKAWQYWTTNWQDEPVWIEAKGDCETETRYAVVMRARIPEDENPYDQPFLQGGDRNVMNNLTLVVERGQWLSFAPGESVCVEASAREVYEFCGPCYLRFPSEEVNERINYGNDVAFDNLPHGDFTVEFWIRNGTDGVGGFRRAPGGAGWYVEAWAGGVYSFATYDTQNARSNTSVGLSGWHHIAITYSGAGARTFRHWIDGVELAYTVQNPGIGVYQVDIAANVLVRAYNDSHMGWSRISDNLRYVVDFVPAARCTVPATDGNTIALWIGAECWGGTVDNMEGTAARDGTILSALWDCDCTDEAVVSGNVDEDGGRVPTCEAQQIFVANKDSMANLTDIWWWDASATAWGTNLRGATLPFYILPNPVGTGDTLYFGIDSTRLNSGPFSSIVFDLLSAWSASPATATWEYYQDGVGWTTIPCFVHRYRGDPLYHRITGVRSIHFKQPDDWVPCNPNPGIPLGITGFFVRCVITTAAALVPPRQQNKDIYTITWPYAEIQSTEVLGDIPALLKLLITNESGQVSCTDLSSDRVVVGLRSVERGESFQSYLNLSTSQNATGITVLTLTANTTFASDAESPTGTSTVFAANVQAFTDECTVELDDTITSDFYGIFHAYLRVKQSAGTLGDIGVRLNVVLGDINSSIKSTTDAAYTQTTAQWETLDLGQITLPPADAPPDIASFIYLTVEIEDTAGVGNLEMWDIILIPVDEWAADICQEVGTGLRSIPLECMASYPPGDRWGDRYADIDSVTTPNRIIRSLVYRSTDDAVRTAYRLIANGPAILQANTRQRLYFFSSFAPLTVHEGVLPRCPRCEIVHTVQLFENQRYLSMRGSR